MDDKDLESGPRGLDYSPNRNPGDVSHDELRRMATSATISPELFERLYLQPRVEVKGDLRKTFANPTPLALMGFAVGLTPLSVEFMGWRGAGGNGEATVGASIWFGGVLLLLAGIGEFILGNTFPFIVFMGYGAHFMTVATTFIPFFNALSAYTNGNPYATGSQEPMPGFDAGFGFYLLSLAILSFVFMLCSLRTNVVFFLVFLSATMGFALGTGGFFQLAMGNVTFGVLLLKGTGGCFFAAAMCGWYMLLAIMVPTMELPIPYLPIVDLSTRIKAKRAKDA